MGNQGSFSDEDDIGGAEGLAQVHDKNQLRTRRCFEIVLESGRVMRFEVRVFGASELVPSLFPLGILLSDESRMGRPIERTSRVLDTTAPC